MRARLSAASLLLQVLLLIPPEALSTRRRNRSDFWGLSGYSREAVGTVAERCSYLTAVAPLKDSETKLLSQVDGEMPPDWTGGRRGEKGESQDPSLSHPITS